MTHEVKNPDGTAIGSRFWHIQVKWQVSALNQIDIIGTCLLRIVAHLAHAFAMLTHKLRKWEYMSGVVLTTPDGARIQVQKAVLAAQSNFFLNAFEGLPDSKEFPISGPSKLLTLALAYICDTSASSQRLGITTDNVHSLLEFFSKYKFPKGIRACDRFLSASIVLSTSSLPEWIILADRHMLPRFLLQCQTYAATRMNLVAGSGAEFWLAQLAPATLVKLVMEVRYCLLE